MVENLIAGCRSLGLGLSFWKFLVMRRSNEFIVGLTRFYRLNHSIEKHIATYQISMQAELA